MTPITAAAAHGAAGAVAAIAGTFAADRRARQRRRQLDAQDFAALADAGYSCAVLPAEEGGLWRGPQTAVRPIASLLRSLAKGDSSVALVAAMHPRCCTARRPRPN